MIELKYPFKSLRSTYLVYRYPNEKMVCFTCGNAGKKLKERGADVITVGSNEDLIPNRWFSQKEIHELFPDRLDVTSGHLRMEDMIFLSDVYKSFIGKLDEHTIYRVNSGSGETLVCLALAYPNCNFIAVYDDSHEETKYNESAPLNKLVELLAYDVIKLKGEEDGN